MSRADEAPNPAEDVRLPSNAFRELAPGETYEPVVPPGQSPPEVTVRSVVQGFAWSVVFSAAATYIALKLGQGIESAIPISILAVGVSVLLVKTMKARASTMLENVNVLAIGATSGVIAGGSVFTMPAIHILDLQDRSSFFQIFLVPLLGAFLGVFFLAPFRRYFVRDLHGKLPFPEGRATTEILVAGKRGGRSAIVLSYSAAVAAVFDFLGPSLKAWAETFSTASIGALTAFTDRTKAVFSLNTSAAVLGLGYIMGLDYAAIILGGSLVSFLALVPLFGWLSQWIPGAISAGAEPLRSLPPDDIFRLYVRPVGIGGIFCAGVLSILKMSPVIVQAVKQALGETARLVRGEGIAAGEVRTDRALPMAANLGGALATGVLVLLYFRFSVLAGEPRATSIALVSTVMALVIAFLFAAVSAWAVAMISITPVSGMTLTTLIVTAVALSAMGLSGKGGMLQTLLIGGVVCTALSASASLVTQYKIAYWLGGTPRWIELANLAGAVVSSAATTAVILLMAKVYGFAPSPSHPNPLPAPQPNAMAAVLTGVMGTEGAPWFLYAVGAVFALSVELCGVSGLAFALGMYLPMDLNSPLVIGAGVSWLLARSSKDEALAKARQEKGTLIASGFIAGGALVGVFSALLRFCEDTWHVPLVPDLTAAKGIGGYLASWGNFNGLAAFLLLAGWVYWNSRRETVEG
ncbi:MAG: oligopeptide transporter, OPT family [Acidobacteria bacterium]|nr:MAG: oligopeptide transporter, OPT family [Acidobacteriota bacterium]MCE7957762.1 oligopeptide transporter, OPT family [Acidobacteria bacterium ACB2]